MNKHLVYNEAEYLKLFDEFDINDKEVMLNVEFAYEDGTYQSDMSNTDEIDEDQPISLTVYRKKHNSKFPKSYPCIVLFKLIDTYSSDLTVEFVYITDFKSPLIKCAICGTRITHVHCSPCNIGYDVIGE